MPSLLLANRYTDEHGYSRLNKAYLSTYKNTSSCKEKIKQFQDIYVRK